jgi:hypothetical protein
MMEEVRISETSVYFEATRRFTSESCNLYTCRSENMKSQILQSISEKSVDVKL